MLRFTRSALLCAALAAFAAGAAETPTFGPELQGFHYPYPLQQFSFTSQGQPLKMGYMDVPPEGSPTAAPRCCCTVKTSAPPPGRTPSRR